MFAQELVPERTSYVHFPTCEFIRKLYRTGLQGELNKRQMSIDKEIQNCEIFELNEVYSSVHKADLGSNFQLELSRLI